MNDEWGLPVSKDKIISRRNRLIEYQKVSELRFTPLYEAIDENILDINYMIYEIERLQKQLADIKFYIEQSDIKNMLWGKEILKIIGGNDERK